MLTFLSITGIAMGIGLFVGVKAATDRAIESFEEHIQGTTPIANYEVVDFSGIDFDEKVYRTVRQLEDQSFPLVRFNGYLPDYRTTIDINGIDSVRVVKFLKIPPARAYDIERYFTELNGVLITRAFADRYRIEQGETVKAYVYNGEYTFRIVGIIEETTLQSNIFFMDIGNFQDYLGKVGVLTRIDVATDRAMAEQIRRALPPNLSLEGKAEVIERQKSLISSFHYNLHFITFLAVLVGVFLLSNTIFITVIKRRTEIGILRGLGTRRRTVVLLFTVKGLILGGIGSILGIMLGQVFTFFSIVAVERTISTIYSVISISDHLITGGDVLQALGLGVLVSLVASVIPAFESAKVRPNESSKAGSFEKKYKPYQPLFTVIGFLCVVAGGIASYADYRFVPFDFPYLSYAGILLFILGCTFSAPLFLSLLLRMIRIPLCSILKATGTITVNDIEGSRYRFSAALMTVAISAALIVSLLSSIFSLKRSFEDWLDTYLVADVFIKPASCISNYCFTPLSDKLVTTVKQFPEVRDVGRFRTLHLDFRGQKVVAGFGDTNMWRKYRKREHPDSERLRSLYKGKEISISDYLKIKYGLKLGDVLQLGTPKGNQSFRITYTSISYSTTAGFLYMDRKWLREYWELDDATQLSIYLKEGSDVQRFIDALNARVQGHYALTITDAKQLRENSMEIFNRSFALTYAIELIAILISLIGVVNILLIMVFEKKRDISIIRYLGGSWAQIRNIIILSAGIVGAAGILLGFIIGPLISIVITHVINKISFGWEVRLHMPLVDLTVLTVVPMVSILAAGLIPSRVARKTDPRKFVSFE
jgi:putative ABC transport system permease protein